MIRLQTFAVMVVVGLSVTACSKDSISAPTAMASPVSSLVVTRGAASGAVLQLTATAGMSDGTSRDVTALATWESSNSALATVSSAGAVNVVGTGEVDIRATFQSTTGALHLQVASLGVVAITLGDAPPSSSSPFQLTAAARLSDGSTQDVTRDATWQSSDVKLATVTSTGFVNVTGTGQVELSATYQGVDGSVRVNVSLPSTFILSGEIRDSTMAANPISGARIQILEIGYALSDDRGAYYFSGVPNGRTIVEVSKDGYLTWSTMIVVNGDSRLNVVLMPTTVLARSQAHVARRYSGLAAQ